MITKIVSYLLLGMLFFSFFLAIVGVTHISTGDEYYTFLSSVSSRFDGWRIEIPNIPKINYIDNSSFDDTGVILKVLIALGNAFFTLVNVLTFVLNVFISLVNIVIQIIQYICTFLYSLKDFIGRLTELNMVRTIV